MKYLKVSGIAELITREAEPVEIFDEALPDKENQGVHKACPSTLGTIKPFVNLLQNNKGGGSARRRGFSGML